MIPKIMILKCTNTVCFSSNLSKCGHVFATREIAHIISFQGSAAQSFKMRFIKGVMDSICTPIFHTLPTVFPATQWLKMRQKVSICTMHISFNFRK